MIHENITLPSPVNDWIEAFNTHDVAAIVPLYSNDAKLYDSGMRHPRQGRAAIEEWFRSRFHTMPDITYTPTSQLFWENTASEESADQRVAITWTARGRTPRFFGWRWIARPFSSDGVSIFTLQDGLIIQQRGYYDHISVIEQALPLLKWIVPRL